MSAPETPLRGWCQTCQAEVDVDGQQGNPEGTVWSHLREEVREIVVPGHAMGCEGDCTEFGCPVPVPDVEHVAVECGPVGVGVQTFVSPELDLELAIDGVLSRYAIPTHGLARGADRGDFASDIAQAVRDLLATSALCPTCEGSGRQPTGVEYNGIQEIGGCSDCMGAGLVPRALVEKVRAELRRVGGDETREPHVQAAMSAVRGRFAENVGAAASRAVATARREWVVGFLFDDDAERVVLVRKNRPEWQAGKLNGVGGKVEPPESIHDAMVREFHEETGVRLWHLNWHHFASLTWEEGIVHFFRAFDSDRLSRVRTMTDEAIERHRVDTLGAPGDGRPFITPNLLWLVPLAAHRHDTYDVIDVVETGTTMRKPGRLDVVPGSPKRPDVVAKIHIDQQQPPSFSAGVAAGYAEGLRDGRNGR